MAVISRRHLVSSNAGAHSTDRMVAAIVNAPYRRVITPAQLADCIASGDVGDWLVHVATFFTDVSPDIVMSFASSHGIDERDLARVYSAIKATTGERNLELEAQFEQLARAT